AAVRAVAKHIELPHVTALVLGGTGPVGCRAAQIRVSQGATVLLASRDVAKAKATCDRLSKVVDGSRLLPSESSATTGVNVVIGAGAAGVELMTEARLREISTLKVAIDLNAVPPAGLGGIEVMDKARDRNGVICYGAIGVGGTKMKIHTAAVQKLFTKNDLVLDTAAIYEIAAEPG